MISPWGSDVYRIPTNDLKEKARKIYKTVDYVSAPKIKFREDIQEVFSVPDYKIIDLAFGSENIDTLIDNESLSKVTAKKELSTENSFVITCGYNKHKAHNHLKIIHALISVKETLPVNTVLFFPMTYGPSDDEYLNEIETKLKENHFTYTIFNQYLSSRDIMVMQKATDLFICIQDTDANSATLQEYLLSGTNIILGQWLRYPQFEEYGIPYWTTPSKDSLKNTLNEYFISPTKISVPKELKEQIKNNAWSVKIKDWYNFYLSL